MRDPTEQSYQERILAVQCYLDQHLDESPRIEDLAGVACFSPFHFHRIFRGMTGEPVADYVRRLRLERAARRLRAGDRPVTQIALDAGYSAPEAFTRAFREHFGLSPTAYRRTAGAARRATATRTAAERNESPLEVRIETLAPARVAFVRYVGPFDQCGGAWVRLFTWAGPRGLVGPATHLIGVWLDDPEVTPPERLRGDLCIPVSGEAAPEGPVGIQELAGGEYAVVTHQGPYRLLGETYARLCGPWLASSGRELRWLPGFEIYRNDPRRVPPEELLTDLYVPLEPRARSCRVETL